MNYLITQNQLNQLLSLENLDSQVRNILESLPVQEIISEINLEPIPELKEEIIPEDILVNEIEPDIIEGEEKIENEELKEEIIFSDTPMEEN